MKLIFGFILSFLLIATTATAAPVSTYKRLVNFEWEPIPGALTYELELTQSKKSGKTFKFKTTDALWNGRLSPGPYMMRLRAHDERDVGGDWSVPAPFDVGLESARLVLPAAKARISGEGQAQAEVKFTWEPVGAATSYQFELQSDDGEFKKHDETKQTSITFKLPVAKPFTWKVTALGRDDVKSETPSLGQFTVLGAKLPKPEVEVPENEFVREVRWKKPDNAASFDIAIVRMNPKSKKWEKVKTADGLKDNALSLEEKLPGGQYKVVVRAKGDLRAPSDVSSATFKVRSGDRSPAAEFTHEVRKSIDHISGWYGIASYLVTQVNYTGKNFDNVSGGLGTTFNAVGGTGRLGAGYFKEDKAWGWLGILDMTGISAQDGKNVTAMSLEASAVWRTAVGDRGEIRVPMGLYYKEHIIALPNLNSATNQGEVEGYQTVNVLGPQVGGEYWYSVSPKFGLQVNAHMYLPLVALKTLNNGAVEMTPSTQFGVLGSYRFTSRFTGLAGVAQRDDKIKYKSSGDFNPGATNEASVSGTYLNLFAEYAF